MAKTPTPPLAVRFKKRFPNGTLQLAPTKTVFNLRKKSGLRQDLALVKKTLQQRHPEWSTPQINESAG